MGEALASTGSARTVGRYALFDEIAAGGMATVHLGRLVGPVGFSRTVAIKRLHAQHAKDADFVAMFIDEARLVARIRHPNVVPTLDVVQADGELLIVMEYVQGETLSKLVRRSVASVQPIPIPIIAAIASGMLHGLHAAHEARGEKGEALEIIHRDVSPQNVIVGIDGIARLLDFGVAKATQRSQSTRNGEVKGKLSYMAPEQLSSDTIDRRADIFSAGVILWEALTGARLFSGATDARVMSQILAADVKPPSEAKPGVPPELDAICMRALARDPKARYATAREMALAIEKASPLAPASEVGVWVESLAHDAIEKRAERVNDIESRSNIYLREGDEVSSASQVRPKPRWKTFAIAGVAAAILIGVVVFFAIGKAKSTPLVAPSALPTAQAMAAIVTATVTATTATTSQAPEASATADLTTHHAVATPPTATHKVTTTTTTTAAKPNCDHPFVIDSNGIKHVKPECM